MKDISIIIPCFDDVRIKSCLESIDEDVEIIVSLNGSTPEVEKIIFEQSINKDLIVVRTPIPNLAAALQVGSVAATTNAVLYIDSDCKFRPGCIRLFRDAIKHHEVVKGNIVFQSDSFISSVIARSREHHTSEILTAYKPPLALLSSIHERIGGYFFDERLQWREDSDLDYRIRKAGIPIHFEEAAIIEHPPLRAWQDIRSAYRYGIGLARARWYGIPLTEVPRSVISTYKSKGILPALYMCVRNFVYNFGTLSEYIKLFLRITK